MPVRKRQRHTQVEVDESGKTVEEQEAENADTGILATNVMCQLVDENGQPTGPQVMMPLGATAQQLDAVLCGLLENDEDKEVPYAFFLGENQISDRLSSAVHKQQKDAWVSKQEKEGRRFRPSDIDACPLAVPEEAVLQIIYKPQAVFKVRPVSRCACALDGHSEAVLVVCFSPDGQVLATGGGDKEIRIWDIMTSTPTETLKGHKGWVQALAWSPNCRCLASGSKDGGLLLWTQTGGYTQWTMHTPGGAAAKPHTNYLSHIAWEPQHRNPQCSRFVSASKDAQLKLWSLVGNTPTLQVSLNGHESCVTCVKWGGSGLIYSSSQDRTIIVWRDSDGVPVRVLKGHGHWVNSLALNTDHVVRTGIYDHEDHDFKTAEEAQQYAQKRYDAVIARSGAERMVSCSDDNTMFLWPSLVGTEASGELKPTARLTGHQGIIFNIAFSPDGTLLASCSADKTVKLWSASTGKFITTFRGHVAAVYHVSWSLDSRLVASGSRDSTLKVWSVAKRELVEDLSGHQDEIFATDWSPDGQRVATGSKDKQIRLWIH
jgi:ribosome assembly protein 4